MKTALVVDDSIYMRSLISDALKAVGFKVIGSVETGEKAIDAALELEPDFITLDNILPDMLGMDVLKVLKQEENISSVILMISAVGQEAVVQQALAIGAADYVVKPFTHDFLCAKFKSLFQTEV